MLQKIVALQKRKPFAKRVYCNQTSLVGGNLDLRYNTMFLLLMVCFTFLLLQRTMRTQSQMRKETSQKTVKTLNPTGKSQEISRITK